MGTHDGQYCEKTQTFHSGVWFTVMKGSEVLPESSYSGRWIEADLSTIHSIHQPIQWMMPSITNIHCNSAYKKGFPVMSVNHSLLWIMKS